MNNGLLKLCGIDLEDALPNGQFIGDSSVQFTMCTADSRNCRAGDVFVAIVGGERDGHDFIGQAIENGASAIVAERLVPTGGVPLCIVNDSRAAYGHLCQNLVGNPSRRMKVIGVTGTNGKTTTSLLIHSVLSMAGMRAGVMGTLGYSDGEAVSDASLTTPPAAVLANYLSRMQANGCGHGVLEVSSHALVQSRIAGIEFDVACVTNVRRDHLDYHGNLANYRSAKGRLLQQVRPDGFAVLNADDPVSRTFVSELDRPALTVGMLRESEISATLIDRIPSEQTFLLECGNDAIPVRTRIIGNHHIYNCLTAAAVGLGYGIDLPTIVRGLEAIEQVPGRLQRIECGQPFGVYVDYAHTPDALNVSLSALREVTDGRVICVFGAGGDRDRAKRPQMGRVVSQAADMAIVTDDNPRTEPSPRIISGIMKGVDPSAQVLVEPDRAAAIEIALEEANEGDCVLVAGKGHENYQIVGSRRLLFDDAQIVRDWLYRSFEGTPSIFEARRAA